MCVVKWVFIMEQYNFLVLNELIEQLSCAVYWKDLDGIYRGHNSFATQDLIKKGYKTSVIGAKDTDLFDTDIANAYHKNDQQALTSLNKQVYIENTRTLDSKEKPIMQLSVKNPLTDQNNNVHGVLGTTYGVSQLNTSFGVATLTKREVDCLAFLYCGSTMKNTATQLSISPKTVETHIESIKNKLCCLNKSEIIGLINLNGLGKGYQHYIRLYSS